VVCRGAEPDVLRAWDRVVESTSGTDVTQLSAWARVRSHAGFAAAYVLASIGGEVEGGAQILYRPVPVLGGFGYVAYGPLISPAATDPAALHEALVRSLVDVARRRVRVLFVQPPEGADDVTAALLGRGFRPSSTDIAPVGSLRIDLTADEDEIRRGFARRLRSWPAKWPARGVVVRPGDERDVPLLADLLAQSAGHQRYRPPSVTYLQAMYRELAPKHAALFVAELRGSPVAADLVTMCGNMVRGRLSGLDRSGEARSLSVPGAIRWEIIRWAKAHGFRWFDLGGLPAEVVHALLAGERHHDPGWPSAVQTKVAYGGAAYSYPPAVEAVWPVPLRIAYDVARRSHRGRRVVEASVRRVRGVRRARGAGEPSR
jgi:hypothetical protein